MGKGCAEAECAPISGAEWARAAVRENLVVGADLIKVVADVDNRILGEDEMKAIVAEAQRGGVKVAVHATTKLGIEAAVNAGVDSVEHGDAATNEMLQKMRDKGIFLGPTAYSREEFEGMFLKTRVMSDADKTGFNAYFEKAIP